MYAFFRYNRVIRFFPSVVFPEKRLVHLHDPEYIASREKSLAWNGENGLLFPSYSAMNKKGVIKYTEGTADEEGRRRRRGGGQHSAGKHTKRGRKGER